MPRYACACCRTLYQAFRTVPPASRVPPPPEGHQVGARKRHTWWNTILSQPYGRRVLTDCLNLEDSQFVAYLESESSPTPAGKSPHTLIEYPKNQVSEGEYNILSGRNPPLYRTLYIVHLTAMQVHQNRGKIAEKHEFSLLATLLMTTCTRCCRRSLTPTRLPEVAATCFVPSCHVRWELAAGGEAIL